MVFTEIYFSITLIYSFQLFFPIKNFLDENRENSASSTESL